MSVSVVIHSLSFQLREGGILVICSFFSFFSAIVAAVQIKGVIECVQEQDRIFFDRAADGRVNYMPKMASLLKYFLGKLWNAKPL